MFRRTALLLAAALAGSAWAQVPVVDATLATIPNIASPQGVAASADGSLLYVAQGSSPSLVWNTTQGCVGAAGGGSQSGSVAIIQTATRTKVAEVAETGRPIHAELDAATGRVHVVVSPVARMRTGHCPYYLDFDPVRRIACVSAEADNAVSEIDMNAVPMDTWLQRAASAGF